MRLDLSSVTYVTAACVFFVLYCVEGLLVVSSSGLGVTSGYIWKGVCVVVYVSYILLPLFSRLRAGVV